MIKYILDNNKYQLTEQEILNITKHYQMDLEIMEKVYFKLEDNIFGVLLKINILKQQKNESELYNFLETIIIIAIRYKKYQLKLLI
jgi:hypothetical protein